MRQHSEGELRLLVRQERNSLTSELVAVESKERELSRRRKEIISRLAELDKADGLLEGGLH